MQDKADNRLLEALPVETSARILAACTPVELPLGTELFRRDEEPRFLYLLTSGMASVVFTSKGGMTIELATQGADSVVGWSFLFGPLLQSSDCSMQVPGSGYRIPLSVMQREFDTCVELRKRILEYAQHQGVAVKQVAACNRLHRAEARFARWLLMVADRLGSEDLTMTQEFLSNLLGTRRTTVAEVCADLGRIGAIEGRRGGLRVINRRILEAHACECYSILSDRYKELYKQPLEALSKAF